MTQVVFFDGRTFGVVGTTGGGERGNPVPLHLGWHSDSSDQFRRHRGQVPVRNSRRPAKEHPMCPITNTNETSASYSVGVVTRLDDGRLRVEDEWEWRIEGRY